MDSPADSILLTDGNMAETPRPTPSGYAHGAQNHPGWWPTVGQLGDAPFPRRGLNIVTLDGSVNWRPDAQTDLRYLCGLGSGTAWYTY